MEESNASDANLLASLLSQGSIQMAQLVAMLDEPCKPLAQQIQFTLQQATSIANSMSSNGARPPPAAFPSNMPSSDSPRSNTDSPPSESSGRIFKDHEGREICKKRKTLPKWTHRVRVISGEAEELKDGFSWRKYGQKDILGAKHPRSYYRCTYRGTLGCLATKQVQRSDDDPAVFDINYRGEHTCLQQQPTQPLPGRQLGEDAADEQLLLSFKKILKVKTEGLDVGDHRVVGPSSFSFSSTPSENNSMMIFSSAPATLEGHFMSRGATSGGFSVPFIAPAASDSSIYPFSAPQPLLNTASDQSEIISQFMEGSGFMLDDFDLSSF